MGKQPTLSKSALTCAVALLTATASPVQAYGGEAHMVELKKTLQDFGADVQWDDYAQMYTLSKDGPDVRFNEVSLREPLKTRFGHLR